MSRRAKHLASVLTTRALATIFPLLLSGAYCLESAPSAFAAEYEGETRLAMRDAVTSQNAIPSPGSSAVNADVLAFVAARDFQPAWTGTPEERATAAEVMTVLAHADEQGLSNSDYAETASRWSKPPAPGAEAAAYELSLTADLLRYAKDVSTGRVLPRNVYKDVQLPAAALDINAALNRAVQGHAIGVFLASLPPPHPEYRNLVAALSRYRDIAAHGGWPAVLPTNEHAFDGKDPRWNALIQRLSAEDSILANSAMSGPDVWNAVMRYQSRNGLAPDGHVGSDTLQALNKPVSQRITQIVANMERWRWMPRSFERRYVSVNIPDQALAYIRDGNVILSSRAIVGRVSSQGKTPILRMTANDVVTNPPWDVPEDIATAQILPHLRRSPNYLAASHMTLLDGPPGDPEGLNINWRKMETMPYQIQQAPGPSSAMGMLMLDSPNPFGVYLHDTPGKTLFQGKGRQESNGCIRVEQMNDLASLALTDDAEAGVEALTEQVSTGQTQRLALDNPLPIYLLYWTAVAEPDGSVGFRDDFYGRDKPLFMALQEPRVSE